MKRKIAEIDNLQCLRLGLCPHVQEVSQSCSYRSCTSQQCVKDFALYCPKRSHVLCFSIEPKQRFLPVEKHSIVDFS